MLTPCRDKIRQTLMYETKASQHQSVHFPFEESKNNEKKVSLDGFSWVGLLFAKFVNRWVGGELGSDFRSTKVQYSCGARNFSQSTQLLENGYLTPQRP